LPAVFLAIFAARFFGLGFALALVLALARAAVFGRAPRRADLAGRRVALAARLRDALPAELALTLPRRASFLAIDVDSVPLSDVSSTAYRKSKAMHSPARPS
jgi:hypothetical protein